VKCGSFPFRGIFAQRHVDPERISKVDARGQRIGWQGQRL